MTVITNNPYYSSGIFEVKKTSLTDGPAPVVAETTAEQKPQSQGVQQVTVLLSNETIAAVYEASNNIGSTDTRLDAGLPEEKTSGQIAKEKFLEYMSLSPQELFFKLKLEAKLKDLGMTMEEFEALPPEEQNKILEEVKREIEEEARKKAENSIQRSQLAEAVQKASPSAQLDASDAEETTDPIDFANLTRAEISEIGNKLFKSGEITLDELFRFEHPDGRLHIKANGQQANLNPNDKIDFIAQTQKAINDMQETGDALKNPATYKMLQSVYDKISKYSEKA